MTSTAKTIAAIGAGNKTISALTKNAQPTPYLFFYPFVILAQRGSIGLKTTAGLPQAEVTMDALPKHHQSLVIILSTLISP